MPKRVTKQEFKQCIKERFPDEEFEVITYNGMGQSASIKCCHCGSILTPSTASNFLIHTKAHGCVNCHGLWRDRERKLAAIKEKYEILETSVKETHTYYKVQCKDCRHIRETTLADLCKHLDCGCKTGVYRGRTGEEFINELNRYQNNEYELISEYKDQITKVLLRHKPCGFIWNVRPADVIYGRSHCPKCGRIESYGARFIRNLLEQANVPFQQEKLLQNSKQRFDFYLEKGDLKIAIEYNGQQHYEEVSIFSQTLAIQQERDNRKRQYCKDHDIELIEIPYIYTEKEITGIVNEIVNRFNDYPIEELG